MSKKKEVLSRGLRNHNPLNIRKSSDLWQGLAQEQTDREFFVFKSNAWGYRAAFVVIRTYVNKYGLKTVADIVRRWAPEQDGNDTGMYIRMVCALTGFREDTEINPLDRDAMVQTVAAMSRVENGVPAAMNEVLEGWKLYWG